MSKVKSKSILYPRYLWNYLHSSDESTLIADLSKDAEERIPLEVRQFFEMLIPLESNLLKDFSNFQVTTEIHDENIEQYLRWQYLRINTLIGIDTIKSDTLEKLDLENKLHWVIDYLEVPTELVVSEKPVKYIIPKKALAQSVTSILNIPNGTSKDLPYEKLCNKLSEHFKSVLPSKMNKSESDTVISLFLYLIDHLTEKSINIKTLYPLLMNLCFREKITELDVLHKYISYQMEIEIEGKRKDYLRNTIIFSLDRYLSEISPALRYEIVNNYFDKLEVPRAKESKERNIRVVRAEGEFSELNIFWETTRTIHNLKEDDLQKYISVCDYIMRRRAAKDLDDNDEYIYFVLNTKLPIKDINYKHPCFHFIDIYNIEKVKRLKRLAALFFEKPYILIESLLHGDISDYVLLDHYFEALGQKRE